jgi:8-oxo-dGTP diphosphatase
VERFAVIPAAYLYLRRGEQVLLQQRAGTGYMDGHWVAGAAGHIEFGETAAACAVREAAEELGVHVAEADLIAITVMQRTNGRPNPIEQRVDWFFAAERWQGTPQVMEPAKCAGVGWFSVADLPHPVPDYERQVLQALREPSAPFFSSFGFD